PFTPSPGKPKIVSTSQSISRSINISATVLAMVCSSMNRLQRETRPSTPFDLRHTYDSRRRSKSPSIARGHCYRRSGPPGGVLHNSLEVTAIRNALRLLQHFPELAVALSL